MSEGETKKSKTSNDAVKKTVAKKTAAKKVAKKKVVRKTVAKKTATKKTVASKTTKSQPVAAPVNAPMNLGKHVYHEASLMVLTPYRFPLDTEKLAIQSARLMGLAFVFIGAFLALFSLPNLQNTIVASVAEVSHQATAVLSQDNAYAVISSHEATPEPSRVSIYKLDDTDADSLLSGYSGEEGPVSVYFFGSPTLAKIMPQEDGTWSYAISDPTTKDNDASYFGVVTEKGTELSNAGYENTALSLAALNGSTMKLVMALAIVIFGMLLLLMGMYLKQHNKPKNPPTTPLEPDLAPIQ